MRLLSIVTRMNVGGPAVQISTLMRGFLDTDVYQLLLTGTVGADERDFLESQGTGLRYSRISHLQRAISPFKDLVALYRITQIISQFQPDVIHTHTSKAGALGRVAVMLSRSKAIRIHTFHGHVLSGYFGSKTERTIIWIERLLAKRTDALIAVGPHVRDDLLERGIGTRSQYAIIPPGVDIVEAPTQGQARSQLGLPTDALIVSFVGRLTPIKRIDRLIDVIRKVSAKVANTHFVVAGAGSDLEMFQREVHQQCLPVTLLGWREDVASVFAASDITVLTSDNEGTPVSLIQAGMYGVPAVATNVGAVSSVVQHQVTGLLTEPTSDAVADSVIRLLVDEEMRSTLASNCRQFYQDEFGSDNLVERHLSVYMQCLNAEGRRGTRR